MAKPSKLDLLKCALALFAGMPAHADQVASHVDVASEVSTANVHQDGALLRGLVVNHGRYRMEDVQLGITYHWRWANEFRPGNTNPGWSATLVLSGTLAPGSSREFSYAPTLPIVDTAQGSFHPEATVVGYTRFDDAAAPVAPAMGR